MEGWGTPALEAAGTRQPLWGCLGGSLDTPQRSPLLSPDATTYAHFLFNAFDADGNGAIRFEVGPRQPPTSPVPAALGVDLPALRPLSGLPVARHDPGCECSHMS